MRRKSFQLVLFFAVFVCLAQGEFYSSINNLYFLTEKLTAITKWLEFYASNRVGFDIYHENNKKFSDGLIKFKAIEKASTADPWGFIGNPINDYFLIKMLAIDLKDMLTSNNDTIGETFFNFLSQTFDPMPTASDFEGAKSALNRLKLMYSLEPKEIISGKLSEERNDLDSYRSLEVDDVLEMMKSSFNSTHYHLTSVWFNETVKMLENKPDLSKFLKENPAFANDLKQYSVALLEKMGAHHVYFGKFVIQKLVDLGLDDNKENYERWQNTFETIVKVNETQSVPYNFYHDPFSLEQHIHMLGSNYKTLCNMKERGDGSNFTCRYANYHPYLYISPGKMEQISADPPVFIFHDFLTDEQAERLKGIAFKKLERARVNSKNPITEARVAMTYFPKNEDSTDPILRYLDRNVGALTNLSTSTSEQWQIGNYGIGGHYAPHFDFFQPGSTNYHTIILENGNRIATFLAFPDGPVRGGNTIFPDLRLSIKPAKKAAVYWLNLSPDLNPNKKTLHGGCPVVLGSKWISNKWIRSAGQVFKSPCPIDNKFA